jgi:hypothetical protein
MDKRLAVVTGDRNTVHYLFHVRNMFFLESGGVICPGVLVQSQRCPRSVRLRAKYLRDKCLSVIVSARPNRSQLMRALETLVIYVAPFFIIGIAARLLMKRRGVDLSDVQTQAGANRRARKVFLLGAWRDED